MRKAVVIAILLTLPALAAKSPKLKVPKSNFGSHTVVRRQQTSTERWAAIRGFREKHPCPSTRVRGGVCPGYNIEYIKPLEIGGKRSPKNLRWRAVAPPVPETEGTR